MRLWLVSAGLLSVRRHSRVYGTGLFFTDPSVSVIICAMLQRGELCFPDGFVRQRSRVYGATQILTSIPTQSNLLALAAMSASSNEMTFDLAMRMVPSFKTVPCPTCTFSEGLGAQLRIPELPLKPADTGSQAIGHIFDIVGDLEENIVTAELLDAFRDGEYDKLPKLRLSMHLAQSVTMKRSR